MYLNRLICVCLKVLCVSLSCVWFSVCVSACVCFRVCRHQCVVSYCLQESLQVDVLSLTVFRSLSRSVCCLHRWVRTAVVPLWIWLDFNTFISVARISATSVFLFHRYSPGFVMTSTAGHTCCGLGFA